MRRFSFWIDEEMFDRLKKAAIQHSHRTVAGMIRYIVMEFLNEKK